MNPTAARLIAFARRHETIADAALAFGILALAGRRARRAAGSARIGAFNTALAVPLVWRRRWPCRSSRRSPRSPASSGSPTSRCSETLRCWSRSSRSPRTSRGGGQYSRRACWALGAVLATARWGSDDAFKTFVGLAGLTLAAAGIGTSVRQRRAFQASLEQRAAAAERARIARELHDIVAHNLSVMIALADGAAFAAERSPERASRRCRTRRRRGVRRSARCAVCSACCETSGRGELLPQPGLRELDELVGQVRAAGLPVTLAVEGDARALPAGAQLTVFRLVQEALTNSLKHAGPGARRQ